MNTKASAASEKPKLRLVKFSYTVPGTWLMKIITSARPRNMSSRASRFAGTPSMSVPGVSLTRFAQPAPMRSQVRGKASSIDMLGYSRFDHDDRLQRVLDAPGGHDALM